MLNTLISPGYSIINSHIRQKSTNFLEPLPYFDNTALNTSRFKKTSRRNNIDNKLDDQFLITQDMIDENRQAYDEKMKKYYSKLDKQDSKLDNITAMIKNIMYQNQNYNYLPENIDPT